MTSVIDKVCSPFKQLPLQLCLVKNNIFQGSTFFVLFNITNGYKVILNNS